MLVTRHLLAIRIETWLNPVLLTPWSRNVRLGMNSSILQDFAVLMRKGEVQGRYETAVDRRPLSRESGSVRLNSAHDYFC